MRDAGRLELKLRAATQQWVLDFSSRAHKSAWAAGVALSLGAASCVRAVDGNSMESAWARWPELRHWREWGSMIQVVRETHRAPASVARRLEIAGGVNRFGRPNYRAVWGWSRL